MPRWMLVAGTAMVLGLGSLLVAAGHTLARDRDAAEHELARDKLASLTEAARGLGADLAHIGDDLALAATIPDERELSAIATVKHAYLVLDARRPDGAALRVTAPGAPSDLVALATPVIDEMIDIARRNPGELHISPGLSSQDDAAAWYRVFARRAANQDVVVAAVIDMRLLVAPPDVLRAGSSRLLVLSAHGVPAPATDPVMAAALHGDARALLHLVADARALHPGTAILDAADARALDLPDARAVAAAVPVPIDSGPPWTLAVVSSTDQLQARHDALVRRMAIGGTLGLLLVACATFYIARNARRAASLEERLRHAELILRSEKLATAGQLSAGIAHEIGTPLNVVRGRTEMVLARLGARAPEAQDLRTVIEQVDHVTRLIQQLLDYVRPQAQHVQSVALSPAMHAVAELLGTQAASRKVTLQVEADDATRAVRADPGQLQQVLVNLVMNAIDACELGGHVTLRATSRAKTAAIEISDDGHGIAAEDRAHVFDPFFTTKKRGRGTGLGLWVVAQVVRAHDAMIEIESARGSGTTFRILWPAEPAEAAS